MPSQSPLNDQPVAHVVVQAELPTLHLLNWCCRFCAVLSVLFLLLQQRKNIEGSLFLIKRRTQPRFQMLVLNKLSTGRGCAAMQFGSSGPWTQWCWCAMK